MLFVNIVLFNIEMLVFISYTDNDIILNISKYIRNSNITVNSKLI